MKPLTASRLGILVICALLLLTSSACMAKVIYVKTTGLDTSDGLTWGTAKKTIAAAITASASGDEIWVAAGTYPQGLTLKNGVGLYGGFAGTETLREQRNWSANIAIVDGLGRTYAIGASSGVTTSTVVDGFTIRGVSVSLDSGGIYCSSASPTISHNTITANTGSGVYCASSSSPIITNNVIAGNSANNAGGGGIYCSYSSPTITNNVITGNSADYGGGGIYCTSSSAPVIANNAITGNSSSSSTGGGAICSVSSSPTIINNTITGNSSNFGNGGIRCSGSAPTIANNTIAGNSGSAISITDNTSPTITNNIVAYNSSGISKTGSIGTPVLKNNCLYGNPEGDYSGLSAGIGDISMDPKLAAVEYGRVHIQPDSPCIDVGDDSVVGAEWLDMDGQSRIQGDHVDIGADESDRVTTWPSAPTTVRVSPAGNDANDGSTWDLAKRTVQAAANAASLSGGEVWVAAGTYTESIVLKPYVFLYGGFAGNESDRSQRNWTANVIIVDGNKASSVVKTSGGHRLNAVDGFTIRNAGSYYGGGILCSYSSPVITNNTITGCAGSGIRCTYSSAAITNNLIHGNGMSSCNGGGIYCYGSNATISNNVISGNLATDQLGGGGGIYCELGRPIITNNTISANRATKGGGIHSSRSGPTITSNLITGNSATSDGGGGTYFISSSSLTIANNTITGNSAPEGGGIYYNGNSSPGIINNAIAYNSSGMYKAALGTLPVIRNNCLYGNTNYDYSGLSAGTGDISADPLFVDRVNGDYRLSAGSPCINKGYNAAPGLPAFDYEGEGRVFGGTVDIGADEWWSLVFSATEIKGAPEGALVKVGATPVSADWAGAFYVENEERTGGIRVEMAGHPAVEDDMVSFAGKVKTSALGERFVAADAVTLGQGTFDVKPFGMANRMLGGGVLGLQDGVWSKQFVQIPGDGFTLDWVQSSGLNNIGLLVATFGSITHAGDGFFYVDDGSALDDGSGHKGVKVLATGLTFPSEGFVKVTGISSCEKNGDKLVRLLRVRKQEDIQ